MPQPRWLDLAWGDFGVAEIAGSRDNTRVVRYYADVGHPQVDNDEVAWCAAFLGSCLERAGIGSTRSLLARSYLSWGEPAGEPHYGAIAVLSRTSDPALGHVGFLVGETAADIILLGGNQSDSVSVQAFPRSRLLGLRWPSPHPSSRTAQQRSIRDPARDPSPTPSSTAPSPTCSRWKAATTTIPTIPAARPIRASRSPCTPATAASRSPPTLSPRSRPS